MSLPALSAAPGTVYLYLSALVADDNAADYAVSTVDRRLASISWLHDKSYYDNPCRPARRKVAISACSSSCNADAHEEWRTHRGTAHPKRGSGRTMQRTSRLEPPGPTRARP